MAHKRRNVVTLDIPRAYLHTDANEEVVMLLKERLEELMVQVDPKLYQKYVITNTKGVKIFYTRMQKA